jgi:hypothetical protein
MQLGKLVRVFALGIGTLGLAACHRGAPILNFQDQPIPASASKLSDDEIARQIKIAGASLGWKFDDAGPGKLRGTHQAQEHTAMIDVSFTRTTYSIILDSSVNLRQSSGGTVSSRYNWWAQNLKNKIDSQLTIAGLQQG